MEVVWLSSIYTSDAFVMALIKPRAVSVWKRKQRSIRMAARGFKTVSRWFPRRFGPPREDEEEDSNERNGLLRSHLDQIVLVAGTDEEAKALALRVEPKTVSLKVSMHCHGCARKVEKQVSKLQGVVSFKVELENKKVTVVGNISPAEVLESVCKVMKRAEILAAPY